MLPTPWPRRLIGPLRLFLIVAWTAFPSRIGAEGPDWWTNPDPALNVIDPNVPPEEVNNNAVANLGQAKWIAYRAYQTLGDIVPPIAAQINIDLTGGATPILANGWNPIAAPNAHLVPLNIGQLKALAYPFYLRLAETVGDQWVEAQLLGLGLPSDPGDPASLHPDYLAADGHYYPWKNIAAPENHNIANLGQLKLCFALELDTLATDSDNDFLPDWREALVGTDPFLPDSDGDGISDGDEDFDGDGISNLDEVLLHGTSPVNPDTDGDGSFDSSEIDQGSDPNDSSEIPPMEVSIVTSGLVDAPISECQTITIPPGGNSYFIVVGLHSAEYPMYTNPADPSEYNDEVTWSVISSSGAALSGSENVNSLHDEWALAETHGSSLLGSSPVYLVEAEVIEADDADDVTININIGAKNIKDSDYHSSVIFAAIPIEQGPEVLAVNGDFDEGLIGAVSGTTGALNDIQNGSLIAGKDSVDGRISGRVIFLL